MNKASLQIFTAQHYTSAVYAVVVCLSVHPSVTHRLTRLTVDKISTVKRIAHFVCNSRASCLMTLCYLVLALMSSRA